MQRVDKKLLTSVNGLMIAIAGGDADSVALLFEMTYAQLYGVAYGYCRHRMTAEDLVADLFANIDYIAAHYKRGQNAFNYLCKIIKNRYLNQIRHNACRPMTQLNENICASKELIDERVCDIDLKEGLKLLDREQYAVIYYKFYEDMTFREIAAKTGTSLGKTQRIYNKALSVLKKYL